VSAERLRLFQGYGIEIEYMIVDRETLAVRPISDRVLAAGAGEVVAEVERGDLAWSNELVMHVIELKTNGPAQRLEGLGERFQEHVREIDEILAPHGARLMPTAMHPWMDPLSETRLWSHEYSPVYEQYNRIFDCRGHGWSNLQSVHVNLPFGDDADFERLHAAIRVLLPLLPALSASSPIVDGLVTPFQDNRMRFYRTNSASVPSVSGEVVPERVYDRAGYEGGLLDGIYRDLAPHDPLGILRHEWVNARGAIARFDRYAIEIRVLDVQEHPGADLAVAALIRSALQALVREEWIDIASQKAAEVAPLAAILWSTVDDSDRAVIRDREYLRLLGHEGASATAGELWRELVERLWPAGSPDRTAWLPALEPILAHGTLSRRIVAALGGSPTRPRIAAVYRHLCDCLHEGRPFLG
jgi:gamma-glutamyl:cysteine ligase YbdK (ATP-grasp superfamily)